MYLNTMGVRKNCFSGGNVGSLLIPVYWKKSFLSTESDTKILQSIFRLQSRHHQLSLQIAIRLPDVLERRGLSLNLLSKLVLSLILEKYLVDL